MLFLFVNTPAIRLVDKFVQLSNYGDNFQIEGVAYCISSLEMTAWYVLLYWKWEPIKVLIFKWRVHLKYIYDKFVILNVAW